METSQKSATTSENARVATLPPILFRKPFEKQPGQSPGCNGPKLAQRIAKAAAVSKGVAKERRGKLFWKFFRVTFFG